MHPKLKELIRRSLSLVMVCLLTSGMVVPAFAAGSSSEGSSSSSSSEPPTQDDNGFQSNPNDRVRINDVNTLSYKLSTAPSAKEAARKSSDLIVANSTEALSGVESLARFLNYKTMTVEDMEAFEWSFIVSQFATPLQDNVIDVLNHSIFLQMAEQGLRIQRNPEATSEGLYMEDPYFNDKVVVDSTDFAAVAKNLQKNTKYIRLQADKGSSIDPNATDALGNVTLRDICEAPVGTIYYVVDEYYTADGRDKENLFIDRLTILREGLSEDKVNRQLIKIPILVVTNNVKVYLQANLGAYMKIHSNVVGGTAVAMTYNDLVGTNGSTGEMGGSNLFVDSWGNILVGHDAKYKMLLPNACNPIFTNSDTTTSIQTAGVMNGSGDDSPLVVVPPDEVDTSGGASSGSGGSSDDSSDDTVDGSTMTQAEYEEQKAYLEEMIRICQVSIDDQPQLIKYQKKLQDLEDAYHSGSSGGSGSSGSTTPRPDDSGSSGGSGTTDNGQSQSADGYMYHYNDRNFAFNKNFVTMYTRQLRISGSSDWEENKGSIVFLDTYRNGHYQNFLDTKKSVPNSHRNSIVIFDPMRLAYPDQVGDNFQAMLGEDGSFMSPLMYFSKDGLPSSYLSTMKGKPDPSDPMAGILQKPNFADDWWDLWGHLKNIGEGFRKFVQGVFADANQLVREVSDAKDPELNGLYYLVHPDSMNITDWWGQSFNESDLPARRYFKVCFQRGIHGGNTFPDVADKTFTEIVGDVQDADSLWEDICKTFSPGHHGKLLAQLFQTYNYMYGVGLNYPKDMQVPNGATNVKTDDFSWWVKGSEDTGLSFIGKDTLDYGQDWGVFTSGENGLLIKEYRPIHTGDQNKYNAAVDEGQNNGEIYSASLFRDDIYTYLLRDTRVSDRWINYGVEDVSLISFVWLNYYIPKLLPVRQLVYQVSDDAAVTKAATFLSSGQSAYPDSAVFKQFREVLNRSYQMTATDTDTEVFGGYTKTTFDPVIKNKTDVIMGPYPELVTVPNYTLKPDTVPLTLNNTHREIKYNSLELLMAIQRNTAWQYNSSELPAIQVTNRDVDSTEILASIWDFLKSPVSSLVNIISGGMQMAYNGLAGSDMANVFGADWIKTSKVYVGIQSSYFLVVGILVSIILVYLLSVFVISRKEKLGTVLMRMLKTVALAMVPLLIFNATLSAIGAISTAFLQGPNAKIAAVETELTIRDRFNNDAGFEKQYQTFKQQFDTIIDTAQGFGVLVPDYYIEGTDTVAYKHVPLKSLNENLRYANSSVWYDHRGFVPAHKNFYQDSLFYYYYDYLKYQFLYYLAETPQADLAGQQEFAKRFEFATESGGEDDWLGQGTRGAYINFCDTQLLRSQGAFFTMFRDPNYVYGESIANKASERWDNAYIQDLFGLGYLFQDTGDESEPFNQFKQGVTWRVFQDTSSLAKVKFTDWATNADRYEYRNNSAYMQFATKNTSEVGYTARDKPYASYTNLYRDYKYIKGLAKPEITPLEAKLITLNDTIYKKVSELVYYDTADMHDEAFIVQAALIATFETNKMFGDMGFLTGAVKPTGFNESSISLDKVFRVMFAKGMNDVAEERNVIYMIVGNGSGILTALIVLLALACLFLAMIARTLLLFVMSILIIILCLLYYVFKQQHRRKLMLGVVVQCGGILGSHLITILCMSGIISLAVVNNNGLAQFFYAVLLLFVCLASLTLHLFLAYCMFKNMKSLGGDMFGYYGEMLKAKLDGRLSGKSKVSNTGDIENSTSNSEDDDYEESEKRKLEDKISKNNQKADGIKGTAAIAATALGVPEAAPLINSVVDEEAGEINESKASKAAKQADWRSQVKADAIKEADAEHAMDSGNLTPTDLDTSIAYQSSGVGNARYAWTDESGAEKTADVYDMDVQRTVTAPGVGTSSEIIAQDMCATTNIPPSATLQTYYANDLDTIQLTPEERQSAGPRGDMGYALPAIPRSRQVDSIHVVPEGESMTMQKSFRVSSLQATEAFNSQAPDPIRMNATQRVPGIARSVRTVRAPAPSCTPIPRSTPEVSFDQSVPKTPDAQRRDHNSVSGAGRSASNVPTIDMDLDNLKPPDMP